MIDSKKKEKKETKERASKYEEKLKTDKSFDEVLKIASKPTKKGKGEK